MKQRKLVIGLLIILAVAVSGFTFAFWSNISLTDTVATNTVTIGEGRQASVTALLGSAGTGTLVPSGEVSNSISAGATETVTFTFNVEWDDNAFVLGSSTLDIVVNNVSNATVEAYLNFDITAPGTLTEGSAAALVTIVITMDPPTETDYPNVINVPVTFDVVFTVSSPTAA